MNDATTTVVRARSIAVPRVWARDGVFVGLTIVHACALAFIPSVPLIAIGLWWNANTIAHNFIHRPFFRSKAATALFSAVLTLVLGVPQRLWRARHLAHHAELAAESRGSAAQTAHVHVRWTLSMLVETELVVMLWAVLAVVYPRFFLTVYLPGWTIGLSLCFLQGYFEHAQGTTSHYGRLYNLLFFNDGYHVEHHARPGASWADLPAQAVPDVNGSRWPAVLRWLDWFSLDALERLVIRSPRLQSFVLDRHERALRRVLAGATNLSRVAVVGGGLFPRTALILRRVFPDASIVVIDASAENLRLARQFLGDDVEYRHQYWDARQTEIADLVIVPLAFQGDRRRVYDRPAASFVLVHDWIWNRRGSGIRVSWLLCKRLNLVRR
jgi:fatty-acid desaturase